MSRRARLVVPLIWLVCGHSAPGDIVGTALGPDGKPAAGVELKLVRQLRADEREVLQTTQSKEGGAFRFVGGETDMPGNRVPGSVQIVARDSAGRFGASDSLRFRSYAPQSVELRLLESTEFNGCVLHLEGTPAVGLRVVPRGVYNPSPDAAREIFVPLLPEHGAAMSATTDGDGRFHLRGVPAGKRITLRLEGDGYGTQEVHCDMASAARIRIDRPRRVEGRLSGEGADLASLSGAKLRISSAEWSARHEGDYLARQRLSEIAVREDGRFLAELTRGKFSTTLDESCAAATPLRGARFEVAEGEAGPLVIPVEPLSSVTGRVVASDTQKGVGGASVEIMYLDASETIVDRRAATTDDAGRYRGFVRRGRVLVAVTDLPEAYYAPPRLGLHKPESDRPVEYPDLVVDPAGRIDGIVVNEAGEPAADAEIVAPTPHDQFFERRGWPRFGANRVGPDGRFSLLQINPNDSVTFFARTATAASDLTTTVIPKEQTGPVRVIVSEKNAVRIRGAVEDENGPAAGQAVTIWAEHYFSTSEGVRLGLGSAVAGAKTDEKGEFVTEALWAGMPYRVTVNSSQGAPLERKVPAGKAGEVLDAGKFGIERTLLTVSGRVVDSAGKPIADARVYAATRGSPRPERRSESDGTFRLERVPGSSTWIFAEKEGYCLSGQPGAAATPLEFVLRARSERAPPFAARPGRAARERAARRIVDAIERAPEIRSDRSYDTVVMYTARFDAERAERMSVAAGGAARNSLISETVRRLEREDADEALALARELPASAAARALRGCAERMADSDLARAVRFAEEAVAVGRTLEDPERSVALAQAGDLLIRLGVRQPGEQLISDAAEAAERFGLTGMDAYYRRAVAWAVAPRDQARALRLVEPIKADTERRIGIETVIARSARSAPDFAATQLKQLEQGYFRDQLAWRVAAGIAQTDPPRGVAIAEAVGQKYYRARALARVAEVIARDDRQRAFGLVEAAMKCLLESSGGISFDNLGGGALFGVEVAAIAERIGYPHVDELLLRSTTLLEPSVSGANALVNGAKLGGAIGLIDPQLGRRWLALMRPSFEKNPARDEWLVRRAWLAAWAAVDPDEAVDLACELLKDYRPGTSEYGLGGIGVTDALGVLTLDDEDTFTERNPLLLNTLLAVRGDEP